MDEHQAAELRRRSLRIASIVVAPVAALITILALTLNVGDTGDSYCGSLIDRDYGWRRHCTTNFRAAASIAVVGGVVALTSIVAVVRLRSHRR